jgi:hypothetical protein
MPRGDQARRPSFFDTDRPTIDAEAAAKCKDTQSRVEYIADLMAEGRYVTRRTSRELRDVWELSLSRVDQLVATAAAVMRTSLGKSDELRTKALATIDSIRTEALIRGRCEEGEFAFKWYEVAMNASSAMLGFTNREHDEAVEQKKLDGPAIGEQTLKVQFVAPERPKEKSE